MKLLEDHNDTLLLDRQSDAVVTAMPWTTQFNFSRNWKSKVAPHLNDPFVNAVLALGLRLDDRRYQPGDPPWHSGRGPINGQRAKSGCLSWYQPWGRCHSIAPFCWAIGRKLFPQLQWGFVSGKFHTVVIGYETDWRHPSWVMDILLFKKFSANDSLAFAQREGTHFYGSFGRYIASFFEQPEQVYEQLEAGVSIN